MSAIHSACGNVLGARTGSNVERLMLLGSRGLELPPANQPAGVTTSNPARLHFLAMGGWHACAEEAAASITSRATGERDESGGLNEAATGMKLINKRRSIRNLSVCLSRRHELVGCGAKRCKRGNSTVEKRQELVVKLRHQLVNSTPNSFILILRPSVAPKFPAGMTQACHNYSFLSNIATARNPAPRSASGIQRP